MKETINTMWSYEHKKTKVFILLLALAFPISLQAQSVPRVSSLMIGGYKLRIGMTTKELVDGIGQAFQYVFSEEHNAFQIKQPDGRSIANALIDQGRVVSISKQFELDDTKDIAALAARAYKEFESARPTTRCTTQMFTGAKISEGQMVNLDTNCGNVTLTAWFFTNNLSKTQPVQTGFSISIR
jgi:hypothetical protein